MRQQELPFGKINENRKLMKVPKKMVEGEIHNLFNVVLLQKQEGYMSYAYTYAQAGLEMKGEKLRVQVLYVLNNLGGWRGEVARSTKVQLNKLMKEL